MAKKKQKTDKNLDQLLKEVRQNYDASKAELSIRANHKTQGFKEYDALYRSHIDSEKWPYQSKMFIPLTFSSLMGKGTRMITGKMKGRLVAQDYSNPIGASIGTELLSAQYNDHDYKFEEPLVAKWFRMDQKARKYGASFGIVGWKTETDSKGNVSYDGPTFEDLDNYKVYLEPTARNISESNYIIVERYISLDEMKRANRAAKALGREPEYINLDLLEEASGDNRDAGSELSFNSELRNTNTHSTNSSFKKFRRLTEYRKDKWITWIPNVGGKDKNGMGVIVRIKDNPFADVGIDLPIIRLVYIPIDEDIYGVSEIEAGRSEQKAINALASGFIDAVNLELFPIFKARNTEVEWNTVKFKSKAVWLMDNPQTDMVRLEGSVSFLSKFVQTFQMLDSKFATSMGDATADSSQMAAFTGNKTATEIRDTALQRGSRDNWNRLMLSSAVTRMYMMWWAMDQKFLSANKLIKVAGREALEFLIDQGLKGYELSDEGYQLVEQYMLEEQVDFDVAYTELAETGALEQFMRPLYPVETENGVIPKLQIPNDGKEGFLMVEPSDLVGNYRYEIDLNTVGEQDENQEAVTMQNWLDRAAKYEPLLQAEGVRVKFKETLQLVADKLGIKNSDSLFENVTDQQQAMAEQQTNQSAGPVDNMGQMGDNMGSNMINPEGLINGANAGADNGILQ